VFERFTERARLVVESAQEEARSLERDHVGTEHLLLALLRDEGLAARVLGSLGVTFEAVREKVEEIVGRGDEAPLGQIPLTPRSKKVLELALREALSLGDDHIRTGHILLGLLREDDGAGARVLAAFDVDYERARGALVTALAAAEPGPVATDASAGGRPLGRVVGLVVAFLLGVLAGRSVRAH
jgi:ATP-dependent Clp protease ATP-binding subunit ClpC